jgi:AAHS family 4-hydroxybenzoate transporter-like MFS transporter
LSQVLAIDELVDGQRIRGFNLSLLFWSFLTMLADGYDIGALSFAIPELQNLWHVPAGAFGPALSASLFGILFGAPVLGYLGDRSGRKTAIIVGSIIYGVSTLGVIWTHDLTQVIVLRFITGIGLGGIMPNTIALNSELAPQRLRATLVVLMFTGITLGSSAPGFIAAWLVPHYGWTVLFLIGGLVPLIVAASLVVALPESIKYLALVPGRRAELVVLARRMRPDLQIAEDARPASASTPPAGTRAVGQIFSGQLALITPLLWVCFATALMANYFLNSWLPILFRNGGLQPAQAAIAASLYHVGGTVGGLLISVLLDRFGFVVIAVLFVIAAPAIAAIGMGGMAYATIAPLATLAGFTVLGAQFGNNAAAGLLYPTAYRSKGVGWALGVGRFGSIAGPLVGGRLIDMHLPMRQLFVAAAIPMLLGALAAIILVRLCYVRLGRLRLSDVPRQAAI